MKATRLIKELLASGTARVAKETRVNPDALGATLAPPPPGKESEAQFQRRLIDYARARGWRIAHFRPARVTRGGKETWETPIAEDGKGFLDLLLLRERPVAIECKVRPRKATPEQEEWLAAWKAAGQEAYLFYPEDHEKINDVLK